MWKGVCVCETVNACRAGCERPSAETHPASASPLERGCRRSCSEDTTDSDEAEEAEVDSKSCNLVIYNPAPRGPVCLHSGLNSKASPGEGPLFHHFTTSTPFLQPVGS